MHYANVCALNLKPCVQYRNPSEISDRERIDQLDIGHMTKFIKWH